MSATAQWVMAHRTAASTGWPWCLRSRQMWKAARMTACRYLVWVLRGAGAATAHVAVILRPRKRRLRSVPRPVGAGNSAARRATTAHRALSGHLGHHRAPQGWGPFQMEAADALVLYRRLVASRSREANPGRGSGAFAEGAEGWVGKGLLLPVMLRTIGAWCQAGIRVWVARELRTRSPYVPYRSVL